MKRVDSGGGLIVPAHFIQATRDSGYKSLGSAIAELIDNSFEAKARNVAVRIERLPGSRVQDVHVSVADDGSGMDAFTLQHALQFGWSSRFNQRDSHGRYGMGLPNASLSHARRVEVCSSTDGQVAQYTYLDVDEIVMGQGELLRKPNAMDMAHFHTISPFKRGTVVTWRNCDRLLDRKLGPLVKRLRNELGRLFRYQLWDGKSIKVNDEAIRPFDPLFLRQGCDSLEGASMYGDVLSYEIGVGARKRRTDVRVTFSVLPVKKWYTMSNEEKNQKGIAKNAGVSIVRAGREIDHGWFFMGQKRKENYDDWWRCEVCFAPDLDELFGVTHTKQEVHPAEQLVQILTPDLERIARELNGNARKAFTVAKRDVRRRRSELVAERADNLLEPPKINGAQRNGSEPTKRSPTDVHIPGLQYRIDFQRLDSSFLYRTELKEARVTVVLNESHPFVREIWPKEADGRGEGNQMQRAIELILLAIARTEIVRAGRDEKRNEEFRRSWSSTLATFLS